MGDDLLQPVHDGQGVRFVPIGPALLELWQDGLLQIHAEPVGLRTPVPTVPGDRIVRAVRGVVRPKAALWQSTHLGLEHVKRVPRGEAGIGPRFEVARFRSVGRLDDLDVTAGLAQLFSQAPLGRGGIGLARLDLFGRQIIPAPRAFVAKLLCCLDQNVLASTNDRHSHVHDPDKWSVLDARLPGDDLGPQVASAFRGALAPIREIEAALSEPPGQIVGASDLSRQVPPRAPVAHKAFPVPFRRMRDTTDVQVVLEVRDLDFAGERVGLDPLDELLIGLVLPACQAIERLQHLWGEPLLLQSAQGRVAVLDDVV